MSDSNLDQILNKSIAAYKNDEIAEASKLPKVLLKHNIVVS